MAVAMPVRNPKQSASPAATLYSPPETWTSNPRALRKGTRPGSRRWTSAPRERKSNAHWSCRIGKPLMTAPHNTFLMQLALERRFVVVTRPLQPPDCRLLGSDRIAIKVVYLGYK